MPHSRTHGLLALFSPHQSRPAFYAMMANGDPRHASFSAPIWRDLLSSSEHDTQMGDQETAGWHDCLSCKSCKAVVGCPSKGGEHLRQINYFSVKGGREATLRWVPLASPLPINHYGSHMLPLKWSTKIVPSPLTMKVVSKLHESAGAHAGGTREDKR